LTEKKCCADKDRICNSDCISYNPDGLTIVRIPRFDRTLPTPQWTWTGTEAWKAIVCKQHGFTIQTLEKVEPDAEIKGHDG
jgi:hypothetical protein